jgi:hypothetical protein
MQIAPVHGTSTIKRGLLVHQRSGCTQQVGFTWIAGSALEKESERVDAALAANPGDTVRCRHRC